MCVVQKIQAHEMQSHIISKLMKWEEQAWKASWLELWKSRCTIEIHSGRDCSWWQLPATIEYQWGKFRNLCHHLEESHQVETTILHWTIIRMFLGHWDFLSDLLLQQNLACHGG